MMPGVSQPDRLPTALRAIWTNLPAVAACGVLVCAGFLPAAFLGAGLTPVGVILTALGVGPVWAAVIAVGDRIADGDDASVWDLARAVRRHGMLGARLAGPVAICAVCELVTLELWQQTRSAWLVAPLVVGTAAVVLALLAAVPAYPIALRHSLRGRDLWRASLEQVAAAPSVALGVVAAAGLGLWLLGLAVSASFLLLVPGPLAVVLCAAMPDPAAHTASLESASPSPYGAPK